MARELSKCAAFPKRLALRATFRQMVLLSWKSIGFADMKLGRISRQLS